MRMGRKATLVAVAAGAVTMAGTASIAIAASSMADTATSVPKIIRTTQFAGYEPSTAPSTVQASFTIPKLTCTSATRAIAAGVELNSLGDVDADAVVWLFCSSGKPAYYAYIQVNQRWHRLFLVHPGNIFIGKVSDITSGASASVTDVTTGATKTMSGKGNGATSAFVGGIYIFNVDTGAVLGVPTFGNIPFRAVKANGKHLGLSNSFERVHGATVQLVPGALTRGNAFKLMFRHN
jgi:hypothetical protein